MAEKIDIKGIQEAVRKKYAEVSSSAEGKFNYPTGRDGRSCRVMILQLSEVCPMNCLSRGCDLSWRSHQPDEKQRLCSGLSRVEQISR